MADIELVIKIPEELLEYFANHNCMSEDGWFSHSSKLLDAFRNGTPLPKGHGRLIDADELKKIIKENDTLTMTGFSVRLCDINNTPTIIEADKVEREDKE